MDPFGRYDRRSGSDDFDHQRRPYAAAGPAERYYERYGRPYYGQHHHHYERGERGCLDRRGRRRVRGVLVIMVVSGLLGWFVWSRLGGWGGLGRDSGAAERSINGKTIEAIIEELAGLVPPRPEMIVPPDAVPLRKPEESVEAASGKAGGDEAKDPIEVPPKPNDSSAGMEADPLDIPLERKTPPVAAAKLASTLNNIQESAEPAAQLQKVLGIGEVSIRRLNDQIEELSKKLSTQSQMVEALQKNLHDPRGGVKQSTMGEEMMRQLGVRSDASQPQAASLKREGFANKVTFKYPPISTIMCHGTSTLDRVCKIKNLCYDPANDRFFIFKEPTTLEVNVPRNRTYLVDTTSLDGHNKFYFDYEEVHPNAFRQRTVQMVDRLTFMISRFHALNIMHTIHDDFLGLYGLHRMFAPNEDTDERFPFSRDNHIVFLDSFENIRYDYVFQFLTNHDLRFRSRLREQHRTSGMPICFRDAVVGNSKIGSWYTYGFLEPQGPIKNKTVSGLFVRDAARFLMNRMALPPWDEALLRATLQELQLRNTQRSQGRPPTGEVSTADAVFITVFSRQLDRLMVNEAEVISGLQARYGLPVRTVRMEDMHLGQQAAILRSTVIAVGVHGSALILGMFLPPGALLVELYPYAVPAENYTPYRTMCGLSGMRLAYRSWTNRKVENNFPHPERPPSGGGIKHLPLAEQEKIQNTLTVPPHLCCRDPYWLYRIYQDTRVDLPELFATIDDGLPEALDQLAVSPQSLVQIRPGVISNVRCKVRPPSPASQPLTNSTMLVMDVSWDEPWNGVIPDKYGIWVHQPYEEFFTDSPSFTPPPCAYGTRYDMWVRSYVRGVGDAARGSNLVKSQYSEKVTCYCRPDAVALLGEEL